ncbi:MAG: NADH-quinone oxidoreductase subunit C [Thermoplasmata archaeon]
MKHIKLPISLEQLELFFKHHLEEAVSDFKKEEIKKGVKQKSMKLIWFTVDRKSFRKAVKLISYVHIPHLSVTSGSDRGDHVELIYHFAVNYGHPGEEVSVNIKVALPKDDLTIPTITDIVPGAVTTEREKQEFLGITVKGIPDSRRLWLDENFPKNRYPWRWDETGMEKMSKYAHDMDQATTPPTVKNPKRGDKDE